MRLSLPGPDLYKIQNGASDGVSSDVNSVDQPVRVEFGRDFRYAIADQPGFSRGATHIERDEIWTTRCARK